MSSTVENAIKELTRTVKEQNKILEAINKNLFQLSNIATQKMMKELSDARDS